MSLGQVPKSRPKDLLEYIVDKVVAIGGQVKRVVVINDGYELTIQIPKEKPDA